MRRLVLLGVVALLLAGCGSSGTGGNRLVVDVDAGSVTVDRHQTLTVDIGDVNESIGDLWQIQQDPDPAILKQADRDYDTGSCDMPGCGGHLSYIFTPVGPGTTTIVFRYCYRSTLPTCDGMVGRGPSDPMTLTVTVT